MGWSLVKFNIECAAVKQRSLSVLGYAVYGEAVRALLKTGGGNEERKRLAESGGCGRGREGAGPGGRIARILDVDSVSGIGLCRLRKADEKNNAATLLCRHMDRCVRNISGLQGHTWKEAGLGCVGVHCLDGYQALVTEDGQQGDEGRDYDGGPPPGQAWMRLSGDGGLLVYRGSGIELGELDFCLLKEDSGSAEIVGALVTRKEMGFKCISIVGGQLIEQVPFRRHGQGCLFVVHCGYYFLLERLQEQVIVTRRDNRHSCNVVTVFSQTLQ